MTASAEPNSLADFASALGLAQWHPAKLTTAQAISVGRKDTGVGWKLIHKLIGCNSKIRDEATLQLWDAASAKKKMVKNGEVDGWDDDSEDEELCSANPVDILLATFVCCDEDLKQLICQKLFSCKLAFPFAYRNDSNQLVTNQWSLRSIVVEYKDTDGRVREVPVFSDVPVLCVAFVRIGTHRLSKSKMLNYILNDDMHQTFFNRDSKNGSSKFRCSRSLVEAAVFVPPEGRKVEPFVALNLRGNVGENLPQAELLSKCASVIVCAVSVEDLLQNVETLKQLVGETNKLILLLTKRDLETRASAEIRDRLREQMGAVWTRVTTVQGFQGKKDKSCREVAGAVMTAIPKVQGDSRCICVQSAASGSCPNEEVSSDDAVSRMKKLACEVTNHFRDSDDVTHFKEKHLPLHLDLWHEYSRLHKKEHSTKARKENHSAIQEEKIKLRNKQVEMCKNPSPIFDRFLSSLQELIKTDTQTHLAIFLEEIRLQLYELCLQCVPELQKAYLAARQTMDACQTDNELSQLKENFSTAEKMLVNASLDLNSFFREAGQLYEASHDNSSKSSSSLDERRIQNLPKLFAQLLLNGIPMEILDGDASNIPLIWVSAVLRACHELAGSRKLFVLSVLGVQSSGKSTLLNTMFGLRFPVSAGRCTRGAYLQLVRVCPDAGLPFEYVAIIDTEGLKAPEFGSGSPHHDNELATLVIGLGDISLVNIKGENSSDMKEILPIAVNAFLRMRQVNKKLEIRRSCIFIHQNVSAVSAKEKMAEAIDVMEKNLDDYTREAAEGEGLADIRQFSDIISFDSDTDIFFMPDLWFGDPPVASVNPGYSAMVSRIREHILDCLSKKQKSFVDFHDFAVRTGDMWKAIMSEDFVFSFRNSVEMKAYHLMELAFIDCKDKLDTAGNDWLHKNAFLTIKKASSDEELEGARHDLPQEMMQSMRGELTSAEEQLENYFKEDPYKEYSIQWKSGKLLALEHACEAKQEELMERMKDATKIQRLEIEQRARNEQWERAALSKAKELAQRLTGSSVSDDIVNEHFERMWQSILDELPSEVPHHAIPIDKQIEDYLYEKFQKDASILQPFLKETPLSLALSDSDITCYISDCLESIRFTEEAAPTAYRKAYDVGESAFESAKQLLGDISKQDSGFYIADVRKLLNAVASVVRDGRSNLAKDGISLTVAFEVKLVIGVCRLALPQFVKMDQAYHEKFSIKARLRVLKEKIFNMFKNMVESKAAEKIAADFVRDHLARLIKEIVLERMVDKLKVAMRNEIGRNKYYLIVLMLTEWADTDDFQSIISYVKESKLAALKWLTVFINRHLFTRNNGHDKTTFAEIIESEIMAPIFKVAHEACEKASQKMVGKTGAQLMKQWCEEFCRIMSQEAAVSGENFVEIYNQQLSEFSDFSNYLKEGFRLKMQELTEEFNQMDENSIRWPGSSSLYSLVLDNLWGCDAQCPFCNEPCLRTIPGHHNSDGDPHKCIQHRPNGVAGMRRILINQVSCETCAFDIQTEDIKFGCSICKSNNVCTDECMNIEVGSCSRKVYHKYCQYKKFFPAWDIAPDPSNSGSKYWMWFMWTFRLELKAVYNYRIDSIPNSWEAISKEAAKQNLRELLS